MEPEVSAPWLYVPVCVLAAGFCCLLVWGQLGPSMEAKGLVGLPAAAAVAAVGVVVVEGGLVVVVVCAETLTHAVQRELRESASLCFSPAPLAGNRPNHACSF